MKIALTWPLAIFAPVIVIALVNACGTSSQSDGSQQASATFSITGADFSGNSVRICGSRMPPADSKYRCISSLTLSDGGCPCFNFAADGTLVGSGAASASIPNLCPSIDRSADASAAQNGEAPWTFTYAIFDSPECQGAQLNDGMHNFTCFDAQDLATKANPNESVEFLEPGPVTNHVVCETVNAEKTFDVLSCTSGNCPTTSTLPDGGCTLRSFACGCSPTGTTCQCGGDAGPTAADLAAVGCQFDATCNIVCDCTTLTTLTTTSTCGISLDYPAIVGPPIPTENCTGIQSASISGVVVTRTSSTGILQTVPRIPVVDGGFALISLALTDAGPSQISPSALIPRLAYGDYQIQWTATDSNGLITGTTAQTVTIRPKIQAAGNFVLGGSITGGDFGGPDSGQPARLQDELALTRPFTPPTPTLADASTPCMRNQKCCQGLIWNSGDAGETDLETGACSGMIMSRPSVDLKDGGLANNDISRQAFLGAATAMNLALATPGVFITNPIAPGAVVGDCDAGLLVNASGSACPSARAPDPSGGPQLPPLPSLATFPATGGPDVTVGDTEQQTLPEGSYGAVAVLDGGTLILTGGSYFFETLSLPAGSQIEAAPDTRVYVANSLLLESSFLASGSGVGCASCAAPATCFTGGRPSEARCVQRIFLGYAGTDPLTVATPFLGTFVAPNASVTFDSPGPLVPPGTPPTGTPPAQFLGSFYAPNIFVATGSELECAIDTPPLDQ